VTSISVVVSMIISVMSSVVFSIPLFAGLFVVKGFPVLSLRFHNIRSDACEKYQQEK
jgi:hypothetical protein